MRKDASETKASAHFLRGRRHIVIVNEEGKYYQLVKEIIGGGSGVLDRLVVGENTWRRSS